MNASITMTYYHADKTQEIFVHMGQMSDSCNNLRDAAMFLADYGWHVKPYHEMGCVGVLAGNGVEYVDMELRVE